MSGKSWAMAVVVGAVVGCHHQNPPAPDRADAFASEPSVPPARQFVTAQAAAGARDDATLRSMHFEGGQLNSLGRQKLDLMTRDENVPRKLVVYLDLPSEAPVKEARMSVADFLKSLGVPDAQIRIEDGPNPSATAPAAKAVEDWHRMTEAKTESKDTSKQYQPSATPPIGDAMKDVSNH